jgi:anti-sigma B factor antagonist
MNDEEKQAMEQLSVTTRDGVAYVRLQGRGTFKISKVMKQFGLSTIEQGCTKIVIDMRQCESMDSTFMGVLAGLAIRLKARGGRVHLVNLTPRTRGLLATLGLDHIVSAAMEGEMPAAFADALASGQAMDTLTARTSTQRETAELMLAAHEHLVDVSAENQLRFKDVLTFLREDIRNAAAEPPAGD